METKPVLAALVKPGSYDHGLSEQLSLFVKAMPAAIWLSCPVKAVPAAVRLSCPLKAVPLSDVRLSCPVKAVPADVRVIMSSQSCVS